MTNFFFLSPQYWHKHETDMKIKAFNKNSALAWLLDTDSDKLNLRTKGHSKISFKEYKISCDLPPQQLSFHKEVLTFNWIVNKPFFDWDKWRLPISSPRESKFQKMSHSGFLWRRKSAPLIAVYKIIHTHFLSNYVIFIDVCNQILDTIS